MYSTSHEGARKDAALAHGNSIITATAMQCPQGEGNNGVGGAPDSKVFPEG